MGRSVYFIQAVPSGPIKIGVATDVRRRLSGIQSGNSEELRVLASAPGDARVEKALHQRFSAFRKLNEWFLPKPELLRLISDVENSGKIPDSIIAAIPPVQVETPSQRIIAAMGGIRSAARRVNKAPTTVQGWSDSGIPSRHQQLVLDACHRDGVLIDGRPIGPADFFDLPDTTTSNGPSQDAAA